MSEEEELETLAMTEASALAIISERMRTLHSDVAEIKGALRMLTEAITKLALVEQKQATHGPLEEARFCEPRRHRVWVCRECVGHRQRGNYAGMQIRNNNGTGISS